jgi:hypothetical protein
MSSQKVKELIPLVLIIGALIYTALTVLMTETILTGKHLLAYGLTSVVAVTYFLNRKISTILLGLTLILGLSNVLSFIPIKVTFGAGIAEAVIELQFYSLIVSVAFAYAHGKAFLVWINKDGV